MKLAQLKKKRDLVYCLNNLSINEQVCIIKHLDKDSINFLTDCLRHIVSQNSRHLKLTANEKQFAAQLWKQHEKVLKKIGRTNKSKIVHSIHKQTGDGTIISALLTAILPLVTSMIAKLFEKKHQNSI